MPNADERILGLLLLQADPVPMRALVAHLVELGMQVDTVVDLEAARASFFGSGGHDCLVVAPDVRPSLAHKVVHSLRAVDPRLATATFGPELAKGRAVSRTARLGGLHPSSRAGQGALVRFLRNLGR